MKNIVIFCLLCVVFSVQSQENKTVKAIVISEQTNKTIPNVHVLNLNQVVGTITDKDGKFSISAAVNDTLYLSFLGFKPVKVRVTMDLLKFKNSKITLTELAYALEEVTVRPYKLTGYLEIDAKNIEINDNYQYRISGLSKGYEAVNKNPSAFSRILKSVLDPAGLLHNLFGKNPRQLRKIRKIKKENEIRDLLSSKFDRQTLTELLQLQRDEIDNILNHCNYSKQFILKANDLQILDAISDCYEKYKLLNNYR